MTFTWLTPDVDNQKRLSLSPLSATTERSARFAERGLQLFGG